MFFAGNFEGNLMLQKVEQNSLILEKQGDLASLATVLKNKFLI